MVIRCLLDAKSVPAYIKKECEQFTPLATNLESLQQEKHTFKDFQTASTAQNNHDPAAPTFEMHGHGASVWCKFGAQNI